MKEVIEAINQDVVIEINNLVKEIRNSDEFKTTLDSLKEADPLYHDTIILVDYLEQIEELYKKNRTHPANSVFRLYSSVSAKEFIDDYYLNQAKKTHLIDGPHIFNKRLYIEKKVAGIISALNLEKNNYSFNEVRDIINKEVNVKEILFN